MHGQYVLARTDADFGGGKDSGSKLFIYWSTSCIEPTLEKLVRRGEGAMEFQALSLSDLTH